MRSSAYNSPEISPPKPIEFMRSKSPLINIRTKLMDNPYSDESIVPTRNIHSESQKKRVYVTDRKNKTALERFMDQKPNPTITVDENVSEVRFSRAGMKI